MPMSALVYGFGIHPEHEYTTERDFILTILVRVISTHLVKLQKEDAATGSVACTLAAFLSL